jgi:hypothetical protein
MNEEAIQKLIDIYSGLEAQLLDEIVKHFKFNEEFINSDYWRFEKLAELGALNSNTIRYIAEATNRTPKEIEKAIKKIGYDTLNINRLKKAYQDRLIKINPNKLIENQVIENLINEAYNELTGRFIEISKKIENATREAYLDVVERAYLQSMNGITHTEAIRNALLDLGDRGISTITYKTVDENGNIKGIRHYDIEGAIRRELVTASHNLVNKINERVAEDLEVEYLYLSEHIRCRPQHFPWQGTIIKRKDLVSVTRYGEVDGLGGPNCKHYPTPYFGKARGDELKQISLEEATEQYNLSQMQRYLERGVRKWKRKERIFKTSEDKEYYLKCKKKVKTWQTRNNNFTKQNKLKRDFSRENVERLIDSNKSDILTPNYIRTNVVDGYNTSNEVTNISNAISKMPKVLQNQLNNTEFEVITKGKTNRDYSRYDRKQNKFYIFEGADEGEVIHEIGHYIETRYNVINDIKYKSIRAKGLENYPIYAVQDLPSYADRKGIKNNKFISELQGMIYNKDLNGSSYIASNGKINLNCLGEYFSEGFREYCENSKRLKMIDIDLYNYIEEVLANVK